MRPSHLCAHRSRVVKTEQAMCIVDQQVELLEEILPKNALHPSIGGMEILEVIHEDLLLSNMVRADFHHVELRVGSRVTGSDSRDHGSTVSIQMKCSGLKGIDHCDLGAAIQ